MICLIFMEVMLLFNWLQEWSELTIASQSILSVWSYVAGNQSAK